ncbi:MAG TPA: hypothetical protein VHQ43_02315 [Solirubrobacterales bacterium]|nr:hypothetical protein [Solirubrobacterales bacterium]
MIDSLIGQGINVRHACRVLGVSESGYYDWKELKKLREQLGKRTPKS